MINQMSSSMRNFMEAYSAVHNKEAKEEFYSHKDEISEMDFSLINQTELDDIAEEVLEELFEEGYSVEQCEAIFEEFLTEARVTYGSDTESPRAKKMSAMKSSMKSAMGKVKQKAAKGAVKSYGAYRSAKQAATDKAARVKQSAVNMSAQTARKAKDAKAGIKSGIKGMIGNAAKKVGDAANKVSSRMSEGTVRKDVGDIYQAIYEKEGSKPDYLDFDGDGNEKEPMKKALSDKKNGKKAISKKEVAEQIDEMGKSDAGVRSRMKISGYEPPTNWDKDANRGKGATVSPKQAEKRRRKSLRQEELEEGHKELPKNKMFRKEEVTTESMKQARKNVGASTCWDGYKAKGTKKKGGKEVPNCVKEDEMKKEGVEFSETELKAFEAIVNSWED